MSRYLPEDHPDVFLDIPIKEKPYDHYVECPRCHGHGHFNLALNQYPERNGDPATKHFRAFCPQCVGWGWVAADGPDATCVHERKELTQAECRERGITHHGMCWHVEECVKCGAISSYDSSG